MAIHNCSVVVDVASLTKTPLSNKTQNDHFLSFFLFYFLPHFALVALSGILIVNVLPVLSVVSGRVADNSGQRPEVA